MSPPSLPATPEPERLLSVACPACSAAIAVDAALLGKAAECPLCAAAFRMPSAAEPRSEPVPGDVTTEQVRDDETAALKRQSAERAARRARRNMVMLAAGGAILLGLVMTLGRGRRRRPR